MKGPIYLGGRGVYEQILADIQAEALLWEVADYSALTFATVFYAALLNNATVARAARLMAPIC